MIYDLSTLLRIDRAVMLAVTWCALAGLVAAPGIARAQTSPTSSQTVVLKPGDIIRVAIWREEDLSGDFTVDSDGNVVFPMLGVVNVGGQPTQVVQEQLLERYRAELRNPSIQITPLRRVIVLGEVLRPGVLEVDPTMTLSAVVALAGGASPNGDPNKISVVRGSEVIEQRVSPVASLTNMEIVSGDQIFVGRRSWFERNSTFLATTAVSVGFLMINLIVR